MPIGPRLKIQHLPTSTPTPHPLSTPSPPASPTLARTATTSSGKSTADGSNDLNVCGGHLLDERGSLGRKSYCAWRGDYPRFKGAVESVASKAGSSEPWF